MFSLALCASDSSRRLLTPTLHKYGSFCWLPMVLVQPTDISVVPLSRSLADRLLRLEYTTVFDYLQLLRGVSVELQVRPVLDGH